MRENSFVMTPGPTEIPLSVLRAMMKPAVSPNDPAFVEVMDETSALLQDVLATKGEVVFFGGSGRVAIESAITSIVEPGDRVLTVNNGVFGKWLGLTVEAAGGENVELAADWRSPVDPEAVRRKLAAQRGIKAVAVVHNETSTGVVNRVADIGAIAKEYGALYLVDTVSSAGGDIVKTDEWGADLNCTGSYKCMNSPPGLGIVAVSDYAWEVMADRRVRRSFSFDLYKWLEMWIPPERGGLLVHGRRRHVVDALPHNTYALNQALKIILEEGLGNRYARNALAGRAVRAGVRALGLELFPLDESYASNTLTVICKPTGISDAAILEVMYRDFGVLIAGGLEEVAGRVLRIAHMGTTADELHVIHTIAALGRTLNRLGWQADTGTGVAAARAVFEDPGS